MVFFHAPDYRETSNPIEGGDMVETVDAPSKAQTFAQLRWYADSYEQAQRGRIRVGEQIRAVLQGRDRAWPIDPMWHVPIGKTKEEKKAGKKRCDEILDEIVGGSPGPVPVLGRTYRRYALDEGSFESEMLAVVELHPTWPWLEEVRGVGAVTGCKLLSRLDIRKAPTISSFWKYGGLATVPGELWKCPTCKKERCWPVGTHVKGQHVTLDGKKCSGKMVKVAGPEHRIRAAMPKGELVEYTNEKGEKKTRRAYDAYAKKLLYLIARAFLRVRGKPSPYAEMYYQFREQLARERPHWAAGGQHYTALRKVEKLFLAHLWLVWREAEGLPVGDPYAHAILGHETEPISPWDMVG